MKKEINIEYFIGKVFIGLYISKEGDIIFETKEEKLAIRNRGLCCEHFYMGDDYDGESLIGSEIILVERIDDNNRHDKYRSKNCTNDEHKMYKWTSYIFSTKKGPTTFKFFRGSDLSLYAEKIKL